MTTWTQAAQAELEQYFQRLRPGLAISGADPDEVIEDLRRHLDAEIAAARLQVVAETDVRRLLARIGAPEIPPAPASAPAPAAVPPPSQPIKSPFRDGVLVFLGVILPALTLGLEWLTGMCAGAFFDPIPTVGHVALVALIPLINGWTWLAVRDVQPRRRALLGWLNGVAIAIAAGYAVIFLPLVLPGIFAIMFLGWGLLPLSPLLSLGAAVALRRRLRRVGDALKPLPGFWGGLAVGALALTAVEAPSTLTRLGFHWAISEDPATERAGLRLLRVIGQEEQLRRNCYGYTRRAQSMDLIGALIAGGNNLTADQARTVYYRVTGQPFNARPAPVVRTARGAFEDLNNWTWDEDHGGEQVGGRIKGLSLVSSRLDALVNPDAAWSYTEWTLEFRNDSSQPREARAQILLPPGGVVSRLTLWVNGEEREAAFAGRSHVREAYREVAVVRRRDPVLVTTTGPDRVLMQCFPVPAAGGTMRVRLGITAPLGLDTLSEAWLRPPAFLERNFTLREGFAHSVWIEGPGLKSVSGKLNATTTPKGASALHGQLGNADLASPVSLVKGTRDPARRNAWASDTRANTRRFIRQVISEDSQPAPRGLVVVVDGSREMQPYLAPLSAALAQRPNGMPMTILIAADEVVELGSQGRGTSDDGLAELAAWRATGGQDNLPALRRAQELAAGTPSSAVLWVHAPEPVSLGSPEPLLQIWQRSATAAPLYEVQTVPGPDRIMEKLDGLSAVQPVPRLGSLEDDLRRLFTIWQSGKIIRPHREATESEAAAKADGAVETSLHLARLWAVEEVRRLAAKRQVTEAIQAASNYQLVTPISGAVVLENQQQYAATGLQPVDPQSVPSIPEPSTASVFLVGVLLLLLARHRQRATLCPG